MYVRDARNHEEVWLLDHIEEMDLDETAFRSRDYVIALDEESNEKVGFGRIRIHPVDGDERSSSGTREAAEDVCELTSIGVLPAWRGQGVGAHVVERLARSARDQGFEAVYTLTSHVDYLRQFGFEVVDADALPEKLQVRLEEKREALDPEAVPLRLPVEAFTMPERLRERFKRAAPAEDDAEEPEESPEDFGIDTESATYKYDTGD